MSAECGVAPPRPQPQPPADHRPTQRRRFGRGGAARAGGGAAQAIEKMAAVLRRRVAVAAKGGRGLWLLGRCFGATAGEVAGAMAATAEVGARRRLGWLWDLQAVPAELPSKLPQLGAVARAAGSVGRSSIIFFLFARSSIIFFLFGRGSLGGRGSSGGLGACL